MRDPAISTRRTRSTDPMPNTDARVKRVQQAEPSSALAAQADSLRVSDLTAFVVTADLGSLSKAAIRLGCAQSVLSRRVQMLESALGGRLFSRTGRGTRLTELGDSLLAHARSMVDAADILLRNAADTLAHPSGIVRVTLPRWSCDGVVSKLVNRVTGQYPHIRLELSEGYSHQVLDWIADAQFQAGKLAEKKNAEAAANKQLPTADGMKLFLGGLADQIKANNYSERAFPSLAPLIDMADKERSGVLGTMDQALLPFKNKAVKERTSACDFTSMDLRGMKDPDTGEWLPVTLYICVNQAEAQAFANITALLYEVLSRDFLSYGPGEKD
nr:LysR family transcriptional regulator [Burkholderiaceae bacterium]